MAEATGLERLLRRERALTAAWLALLCLLAWAYVASGAGLGGDAGRMTRLSLFPHTAAAPAMDMPGMDMGGMAMDEAPAGAWPLRLWALTAVMWWTMMLAMMTPS